MRADAGSVGSVIINLHRRSADPPRMINLLDEDRDKELSKLLPKFGVEAPSAVAAPAPRGLSDAGAVALPEGPSPTQPCQSPVDESEGVVGAGAPDGEDEADACHKVPLPSGGPVPHSFTELGTVQTPCRLAF